MNCEGETSTKAILLNFNTNTTSNISKAEVEMLGIKMGGMGASWST
jgi:hypothetical protein